MSESNYWVRLSVDGDDVGSGFFVTRRLVLTAAHCVRSVEPDGRPVEVRLPSQAVLTGRVEQVLEKVDLALVKVFDEVPDEVRLPIADIGRPREEWFAPSRPSVKDPHLSGTVVAEAIDYQCDGGGIVSALQLETAQNLGDFHGYSGGPVERHGGSASAVLGLLIEQYPDRVAAHRAANVLFAAAIGPALRHFDSFDIGHLLRVLAPPSASPQELPGPMPDDASPLGRTRDQIAAAELKLAALRRWVNDGLLEPTELPDLQLRVAQSLVTEVTTMTGPL